MQPIAYDLLITATETNNRHGVGILLQRYFPTSNQFICLRTTSLYNSDEPFGAFHYELASRFFTLQETEEHLRRILSAHKVRRILCIPYYREEFVHAILAKRITGASLVSYIMDDQNIFSSHVSNSWVKKLLETSDSVIGISPELCQAYEKKYLKEIHLLPPVIPHTPKFVSCYFKKEKDQVIHGAMIGNVWTAKQFSQLRSILRGSNIRLYWYGNGAHASWLAGTPTEWEQDNIFCTGFMPEQDLVAALASYPFIIVPSGSLDSDDTNPSFSYLSLPSRLLFIHTHTDTPVLLLGSPETAAGHFINHFKTGLCCNYEQAEFLETIDKLLTPSVRIDIAEAIRKSKADFIYRTPDSWIWHTLDSNITACNFKKIFSYSAKWLTSFPSPNFDIKKEQSNPPTLLKFNYVKEIAADRHTVINLYQMEISQLYQLSILHTLKQLDSSNLKIIHIGLQPADWLTNITSRENVWHLEDIEKWKADGYSGDPRLLINLAGERHDNVFPQFDAIVSTGWLGQLSDDPHTLEGTKLYLEGCTRDHGLNIHYFSAVLNPTFFWTPPAQKFLADKYLNAGERADLDTIISSEDTFFMSQTAYEKFWQPSTLKSYKDFGKILGLCVSWKNRAKRSLIYS